MSDFLKGIGEQIKGIAQGEFGEAVGDTAEDVIKGKDVDPEKRAENTKEKIEKKSRQAAGRAVNRAIQGIFRK